MGLLKDLFTRKKPKIDDSAARETHSIPNKKRSEKRAKEALAYISIQLEIAELNKVTVELKKRNDVTEKEYKKHINTFYKKQSLLIKRLQIIPKSSLAKPIQEKINQTLSKAKESSTQLVHSFQKGEYKESFDHFFQTQQALYLVTKELSKHANAVLSEAKTALAENEQSKKILEFAEHIDAVIEYKEELAAEISKRKKLQKRKELLLQLITFLANQAWDSAREFRSQHRNPRSVQFSEMVTVADIIDSDHFSDSQFEAILEEISGWDRSDLLDFETYFGKVSGLKNFTQSNQKQNPGAIKTKLTQLIDAETSTNQPNLKKIVQFFRKNGSPLTVNLLMDMLQKNEEQLVISEKTGPNHLELYEKYYLTSEFFNESGDELFMGMYLMLITLGLIEDDTYDPLAPHKKLTQHLIVDAYAKRRTEDTSIESDERWLTTEQALTYYSWLRGKLNLSSVTEAQEKEVIEKLLDHFWWNEVGRPSIQFAKTHDGERQTDEYGPIVTKIYNKENISFGPSREHGKYILRKTLTKEARERMTQVDQLQFVAASVYFQLHAMINERRDRENKKTGIGIEDVPLPQRETYYVTYSNQNQWKKIPVDGSFFTSKEYGEIGSPESISAFITQFTESVMTDENWHEFDEQTLQRLQIEADRAYSLRRRHKEKYQDIESKISDLDDFTAADIGVGFISSNITTQADPLLRSLYTSTFGGRKQINMMFGVDRKGFIQQIVNAVAHKHLDGAPARVESEHVFEQALKGLESTQQSSVGVPINKGQVITSADKMEERNQNKSKVLQGRIEGYNGEFRAECNTIFAFYKEKLGIEIDKNTIIQLAIHLFQDMTHTHFLESRDGILAPALSFYPSHALLLLQSRLGSEMTRDEAMEILAASQTMKRDRMAVKSGGGIIPVNAMLTGANGASSTMRELIGTTAETLHAEVTLPLTRSTMTSAVSGSREPFPSHPLFKQDFFTTALDNVYYDKGAFGFSDIDHDIGVTYRFIDSDKTPDHLKNMTNQEFNRKINDSLVTALRFFQTAMKHFELDPPFEATGKTPWKKTVQNQHSR